jgi:RNA polymerase subunit RPABC4/transcription elongation factor Spt4
MTFALFGIENDGLNLAVNLLVFFLFVIYVALVYWTYADAVRRLDDPMLIGCATVASLFPFIGTIVYTIVRPPEYLEDMHERELEIRAAEKRLALLENRTCRNCGSEVESSFLRCPTCMRKLKEPCRNCSRPLDPRWKVCPYCEAEVPSIESTTRAERSRRRTRRQSTRDEPRLQRTASDRNAAERPERPPSVDEPLPEREVAPRPWTEPSSS